MKPEHRRKQILEIAKKVFAARGYYNTNIEMICKKAGVGRGTIYRYFKNKEDIFAVLLDNESPTPLVIEPLDCSFRHRPNSNKIIETLHITAIN